MAHESSNDLNTPMILVIGLICSVATFVIILGLIGMFHTVRERQEQRQIAVEYADPDTVLDSQRAALREAAWVDAGTGQVRIPIDVAMTKVVSRLSEDRSVDPVRSSKFASSQAVVSDDASMQQAGDAGNADGGEDAAGPTQDPEDVENDKSDAPQSQAIEEKQENEPLEKVEALSEVDDE